MATYYSIYQTTNLVNGKTYIGAHKTSDPWDSYLGSGVALSRAIQKHGRHSFIKEVLAVFDNPEDMWATEKRLVNETFISTSQTYNGKLGGCGGFDHATRADLSNWGKRGAIFGASKGGTKSVDLKLGIHAMTKEERQLCGSKGGKAPRRARSETHKANLAKAMLGKIMSAETKIKMSEARKLDWIKRKQVVLGNGLEPISNAHQALILPLN